MVILIINATNLSWYLIFLEKLKGDFKVGGKTEYLLNLEFNFQSCQPEIGIRKVWKKLEVLIIFSLKK